MTALKFLAVWTLMIAANLAVWVGGAWLLLTHPAWLVYTVAVVGIVGAGWWALRMVPKRQRECTRYERCPECEDAP